VESAECRVKNSTTATAGTGNRQPGTGWQQTAGTGIREGATGNQKQTRGTAAGCSGETGERLTRGSETAGSHVGLPLPAAVRRAVVGRPYVAAHAVVVAWQPARGTRTP